MRDRAWFWSIVQPVGRQGTNYIVFVVLALRLSPEHFGIVALATSWIAAVSVFAELGFGAALVQRKEVTPAHLSTTFAINTTLGAALTAAGIALAGPLTRFYDVPASRVVFQMLSLSFLLNAVSVTQMALAQRDLRFRDLAVRDMGASVVGGVIGIVLALMGFGVWSLVAQVLLTALVGAVILWHISPWRPRLADVSADSVRELWPYSSRVFGFNLFKYFSQNLDKLLIGYLAGPATLGLYTFAYRMVVYPVATLSGALGNYFFVSFSRMQHDLGRVRGMYFRTGRAQAALLLPALAAIAAAAPSAVPLVFGREWSAAIPFVQVFCVVAAAQALMGPVGQLMKSLDRPGWMLNWSVGFTALVLIGIAGGSNWGPIGIASGVALAYTVGLGICAFLAARLLEVGSGQLAAATAPAVLLSGIVGAAMLLILQWGQGASGVRLAAAALAGMVAFWIALPRLDRTAWESIVQVLRRP
ncbi:MAG TPA: lipopolysaccharide biosynthesis protein [Gemmatimonadales bacterium]|nr:lipopolysaccharide biosynthesis protein [Gemmatimonadales bacterium]